MTDTQDKLNPEGQPLHERIISSIKDQISSSVHRYDDPTNYSREYKDKVRIYAGYLNLLVEQDFAESAFEYIKIGGWRDEKEGIEHPGLAHITLTRLKEDANRPGIERSEDRGMNTIMAWGLQELYNNEAFDGLLGENYVSDRRVERYKQEIEDMRRNVGNSFQKVFENSDNTYALRYLIGDMLHKKYYIHVIQVITMLINQGGENFILDQDEDSEIADFFEESVRKAVVELLNLGEYERVYTKLKPEIEEELPPFIDYDALGSGR